MDDIVSIIMELRGAERVQTEQGRDAGDGGWEWGGLRERLAEVADRRMESTE